MGLSAVTGGGWKTPPPGFPMPAAGRPADESGVSPMTASMNGPGEVEIELGEGFADDDVTVLVDGQELWRQDNVSTNWSVGIADVVRVTAPASGSPAVEVRARGAAAVLRVDASGGGRVRLRANLDPHGDLHLGPATGGPVF